MQTKPQLELVDNEKEITAFDKSSFRNQTSAIDKKSTEAKAFINVQALAMLYIFTQRSFSLAQVCGP